MAGHPPSDRTSTKSPKVDIFDYLQEQVLKEESSLPSAISHKKLNELFTSAQKDHLASEGDLDHSLEGKERFKQLLIDWSSLTSELLEALSKKHGYIVEGRSPKSLMALGALEAHLKMAKGAQEASESD